METLTENCIKIEKDGKEIYILGTAHVLLDSKKEVGELIDQIDPDTVCVELCDSRYQSLKDKSKWKNLDIIKVIREGKGFLLLANMILSGFQKKIGVDLESAPGDEMIAAFQIAEERNKTVVLADRDVNVTLKRAWALSKGKDRISLLELLLESLFVNEKVEKQDVNDLLKGGDMFNEMMGMFSEKLPKVKQVFIDERDEFIANKIITAPGKKIVAVVGKGHQKGIREYIEKDKTYQPEIETVPPKGKFSKIIPWLITVIIIGIIAAGFILKGKDVGLSMIWIWFLVTGISTTVFTALVLAHPLTILASWIPALIKIVLPPTSSGIILAPIEAYLRKPRVSDFEKLNQDMTSVKGFFTNRVTRVLLVFVFADIGSATGHFIAITWIAKLLAAH